MLPYLSALSPCCPLVNILGRPANANVVLEVNRDRFFELMKLGLE